MLVTLPSHVGMRWTCYSMKICYIWHVLEDVKTLGENPLRCIPHDKKKPSPYYNPFLPYILIPIKNMNKKLLKFSKGLYFKLLQF